MANPNKKWGSEHERQGREIATKNGYPVLDLAEGGGYDPGDWAFQLPTGDWLIVESKAAAKLPMSIHGIIGKARRKADRANLPIVPFGVVLHWKRLVKNKNGRRVRPEGHVRTTVSMSEETFFDLLACIPKDSGPGGLI